ncbi:MAG: hypothetical protein ACO3RU_05390 [Planctomycetota bacterium]
MPHETRTLLTLPKSADLQVKMRLLHVAGRPVLELVDYIPSIDQYGRGFWLPVHSPEQLHALAQALTDAADDAS